MSRDASTAEYSQLARIAQAHSGLTLLVLHGSRARRDAREDSDWDFAFASEADTDIPHLYADLAAALGTDLVDLVDLGTAGGLIRYRVARDGVLLHESEPGTFEKFWFAAVSFWCDAAPVLRSSYESIIEGLNP
jgi:predicted nucleotidyltransferase